MRIYAIRIYTYFIRIHMHTTELLVSGLESEVSAIICIHIYIYRYIWNIYIYIHIHM